TRTTSLREGRSDRPMRGRRPGQVRTVRLLPRTRLIDLVGRRNIDRMVQPSMPGRRHRRGLRIAIVDDPAPLEAERRIDLSATGAIVAIAEFVVADDFAKPP